MPIFMPFVLNVGTFQRNCMKDIPHHANTKHFQITMMKFEIIHNGQYQITEIYQYMYQLQLYQAICDREEENGALNAH